MLRKEEHINFLRYREISIVEHALVEPEENNIYSESYSEAIKLVLKKLKRDCMDLQEIALTYMTRMYE